MNGEIKGGGGSSVRIDITMPSKAALPDNSKSDSGGGGGSQAVVPMRKWIMDMWEFAKEDSDRVTFSLKVGLACLLVSLLILIRAPYQVFGTNIIWSILTVAIMFEYTVGKHA